MTVICRTPGDRDKPCLAGETGPRAVGRVQSWPSLMQDPALEQLGINVIRGLAMDAPARANSGHSGTAMALAPAGARLVHPGHAPRPDRPRLARPRPLRAVVRPRLDPAVLDAVPDRLRADPRRPEGLPHGGQPHPGSPRAPAHRRRRGHHRTPRSGGRRRRRHGRGRAGAPGLASAPSSATTTPSSSAATAASRRASRTRPRRWPAISDWGGSSTSTTTTTSRSTARPSSPTPTTCPSASRPTAGTSTRSARWPTTPRCSRRRCDGPWPTGGQAVADRAAEPHRLAGPRHRGHQGGPREPAQAPTRSATTKEILGLPPDESFWVPDAVLDFYRRCIARGEALRAEWQARFDASDVDRAAWDAVVVRARPRRMGGQAADLRGRRRAWPPVGPSTPASTRPRRVIPGLLAGAGRPHREHRRDTGRCRAPVAGAPRRPAALLRDPGARHGCGDDRHGRCTAASSRSAAPSSPSATTCARRSGWPPCRGTHVIYSWTHDSIGVGEDGPTHEPIEHLASLRAMPGLWPSSGRPTPTSARRPGGARSRPTSRSR